MDNQFQVEILPDGKICIKSPGGFSKEIHADADQFLDMMLDLAGGEVTTKNLKPSLGNPHAARQGFGQQHRH